MQAFKLVRKTIEISNKPEASSYRKEGDIMSVLRLVDHPNIVRLVATFSHRETYNLLFFPAECNLYELLNKEVRMPAFQTDAAFFIALQGLSSALATLHQFSAVDFDIDKSGCHHDLKPSNILVDKDKFLLADFGLSKLKPPDTDSKSLFNGADSDYLAPECEFGDVAFKRGLVGRMSDVWAFGCIIAELVTHIVRGSDGVKKFKQGRKAKVQAWTLYLFHHEGQRHEFVQTWLRDLNHAAPLAFAGVFPLLQEMLEIKPEDRVNATMVCSTISLLALRVQFQSVADTMEQLLKCRANIYSLTVERERLRLWESVTRLQQAGATWHTVTSTLRDGVEFTTISQCLSTLTTFLNTLNVSEYDTGTFSLTMRQLRRHSDTLINLLRSEFKENLTSLLEIRLLQSANESDLERIQVEGGDVSALSNLRLLAVAKLMSSARDTNTMVEPVKRFDTSNVAVQKEFGAQSDLAKLRLTAGSDICIPVLVEWLPYNIRWTGEVGKELFARVEALASTLRQKEKPSGFLNLYCSGYHHDVQRHSFGLVFEFPELAAPHHPTTLKQMMTDLKAVEKRPVLGQIFNFSGVLASSLLQFHKANWLHKSVSSLNICFFPSDANHMRDAFTKPYLIGFNHSRQGDTNAFTSGPHENPIQADYSHPDYLKDEKRFHPVHDYYSLGIVLLELGLWRTLESMSQSMAKVEEDQSPENFRAFLLRSYVPRLGHEMGETFQKVVFKCLTSSFDSMASVLTGSNESVLREFEEEVVMPLQSCYAL
jgi:serine/threonine protein kinase